MARRFLVPALALLLVLAVAPAVRAAGFGEPGPVVAVEILLHDRDADLQVLADLRIDVDAVTFDRVRAYVVAEEMDKLEALGFDVALAPVEIPSLDTGDVSVRAPGS